MTNGVRNRKKSRFLKDTTIPVDAFTPSSECGKCHQSAYKEWRGSIHYFSHYDPIYQNELAQAKVSAGSDISHKCSICHTPLAALADLSIYSDEMYFEINSEGYTSHNVIYWTKLPNYPWEE